MPFPQLKTLLLLTFLIICSQTQNTRLTTAIQTILPVPLKTSLFRKTIPTSAASNISLCGPNEVENTLKVCIKPNYIEGCDLYESFSTCNKCSSGYSLNKDKKCTYLTTFTGVVTHIKGCIKQISDVCSVCAQGFLQKDSKCVLRVRNCVLQNKDGECTECQKHFSLILSQCRKNPLLGCKYETQSQTCSECYPPFKLNGNHCDIDQCRILNDYGCVACECGHYLTLERDCKPIATGCLRYEKGICKNCLPHYKLKGGVCEIEGCVDYSGSYCKKCSDKYDLLDGECKFKNCLDWLNDQCVTCKQGFALKTGVCVTANTLTCQ